MAAQNALKRLGLTAGDLDLVEINEAFASVTLISSRRPGHGPGHRQRQRRRDRPRPPHRRQRRAPPDDALIYELKRRGGGIGLAAICSGTAQGDAIVVQVDSGLAKGVRPGRTPFKAGVTVWGC